jgi:hypothetical protein
MSVDREAKRSITRKPAHYLPWGGDPDGDFYKPPRAAVTYGPTAYDVSMDAMPNANQVELHFTNYFMSGEMSRMPHWVRAHWTADAERPMPKQDRRAAAFKEVHPHTHREHPRSAACKGDHCPLPHART